MRPPLTTSFLEGKCLLLTGATGFLGKVLLELILRDHSKLVDRIYCLVRPGDNNDGGVTARLFNIFEDRLFHPLRTRLGPDTFYTLVWSKVVAIPGDLSLSGLGISESDRFRLNSRVHYVINTATTADFNERLDKSVQVNTLGTLRLMDFCDECKAVVGLVHISTVFVNATESSLGTSASVIDVEEKVYPMAEAASKVVDEIKRMKFPQLADFTRRVTRNYPNTHAYTKALTEQLILARVDKMREREVLSGKRAFAVCMIRPSILSAICHEPIPGWIDGVSSLTGLAIYTGLGAVESKKFNGAFADLVPVDYVANTVLRACAALSPPGPNFHLPVEGQLEKDMYPSIYHVASSTINPLTWADFGKRLMDSWSRLPSPSRATFPPAFQRYSPKLQYDTLVYLKQQHKFSVVSMLLSLDDTFRLRQLRSKLFFLYHCSAHFSSRTWRFQTDHTVRMEDFQKGRRDIISSKLDTRAFRLIPWRRYIGKMMFGFAHFILCEPPAIPRPRLVEGWACLLRQPSFPALPETDDVDMLLSLYYDVRSTWAELNGESLNKAILRDTEVKRWQSRFPEKKRMLDQVLEASSGMMGMNCRERGFDGDCLGLVHTGLLGACRTLQVHLPKIERLRSHLSLNPKARIIYLPTHYSNADYAVLAFVLSRCALPVPVVVAESSTRMLGYRETSHGLVARDLFRPLPEFPTHRRLHHILKLGGAVAIFLDNAPHALPTDGGYRSPKFPAVIRDSTVRGSSFLANDYLHKVLQGLQKDRVPLESVTLVPVSISYERSPDGSRLAQLWSGSGRWDENPASVSEGGSGPRGRIYVSFGNPVGLDRLEAQADQLRRLDLEGHAQALPSHLIRTCQNQNQLISPTALMALIVGAHRTLSGLSFPRARSLLIKLRMEAEAKSFRVDWRGDEDPSAILSYALATLGPSIVTLASGATTRICLCPGESAALQLRMLVRQAHHLFIPDALWVASYRWSRVIEGDLPALVTIQRIYHFLSELVQPHHPSLQANEFAVVTRRVEKAGWFHISSSSVIINANPPIQDYLSCTLAILHPSMESLWSLAQVLEEDSTQNSWPIHHLVTRVQQTIRKTQSPYAEAAAAPEIHCALSSLASLGILDLKDSTVSLLSEGLSSSHVNFLQSHFPLQDPALLFDRPSHLRLLMQSIDPFRLPLMPPSVKIHPDPSLPELIASSPSTKYTSGSCSPTTTITMSPLLQLANSKPRFPHLLFQSGPIRPYLPNRTLFHPPRWKPNPLPLLLRA